MFPTVSNLRGIFAALLLLAASLVQAQEDRYEQKFSRTLAYHGGNVTIDHRLGGLTLRVHEGPTVDVRATIRSSDDALGRQIRIHATESAGGVAIRTEIPEVKNHRGHLSYSVEMHVTVPSNAPVHAKNRFGSMDARGLRASSVLENKQGPLTFRDGRGSHTLENSFGPIEASNHTGNLAVRNSNGPISVTKINGSVDVTNRFGPVSVQDIQQSASINNANGPIDVMDIGGSLKLVNAFGPVEVSTV